MTYWGEHDYEGVNHPGTASFSNGEAGRIRPYENEDADEIAAELGLEAREATNPDSLGTTFLVVDAQVQPRDLVRAIEISWWPAIIEGDFVATVRDVDGSTLVPRPM